MPIRILPILLVIFFKILELLKLDLPGYAIGGLSGGEKKEEFWRIVALCSDLLPSHKPRYCMGVG